MSLWVQSPRLVQISRVGGVRSYDKGDDRPKSKSDNVMRNRRFWTQLYRDIRGSFCLFELSC